MREIEMRLRVLFLLLLFSSGITISSSAQDRKPGDKDEVIKVDTQLVDVPLAVVSPAGAPLRGLKASNFVVYEDGKRQDVVDFSTTSAPFEVALVLDTSGSARGDLPLIQRAARDFISNLRAGDRVAVIAFNTDRKSSQAFAVSEVLTPLTDNRTALRTAIDNAKTSNGTPYYDSLLQVAEKVFSQRPADEFRGRRALVALTDGVDSSSIGDFRSVREELSQVGVISFFIQVDTQEYFEESLLGDCQIATRFSGAQIRRYYQTIAAKGKRMEKAVNFCGLGDFERLAISKKLYEIAADEMNDLAKSSGGKVFPVGDFSEARNAFKSVADEIGTKYTLGYYSSNDKKDGTYRKIKVDVIGLPKGGSVRAREGYTAPTN